MERWTAKRKRLLIEDVRGGLVEREAALAGHDVTLEEFAEWVLALDEHGPEGLKTTKLQLHRQATRCKRKARKR